MTRKDYEKIAAVLAGSRPIGEYGAMHEWETIINRMATMLKADNERFDRVRFIEAVWSS